MTQDYLLMIVLCNDFVKNFDCFKSFLRIGNTGKFIQENISDKLCKSHDRCNPFHFPIHINFIDLKTRIPLMASKRKAVAAA